MSRQRQLHYSHLFEGLLAQRIDGSISSQVLAQSLSPDEPATWILSVTLLRRSRDGWLERAVLLPPTCGSVDLASGELFPTATTPVRIGPLTLNAADAERGDAILVELGSLGQASLSGWGTDNAWVEFSADLRMKPIETKHRRIGRCVYCGAAEPNLSREHVIPFGLNGDLVLQEASCEGCRKATSEVEQELLRAALWEARTALSMRSRDAAKRPKHFPIRIERAGQWTSAKSPVADYPAYLTMPVFDPPGGLDAPSTDTIRCRYAWVQQVAGKSFEELATEHGADYVGARKRYEIHKFARAIGKIGHCFAVLSYSLDAIDEAYVTPAIRGLSTDIGRWVGNPEGPPLLPDTGLHGCRVHVTNGEIRAHVRLFAQFGAPEYVVIVGRLRAGVALDG